MTLTTITLLVMAFIVLAGLYFMRKKSNTSSDTLPTPLVTQYNIDDAEKFVKRLTDLGYFKYADSKDVDTLQKHLIKEYDPTNEFVSIWDEYTSRPKDYRYYFCDNETLFEEGGFTEILKDLMPTFDKIHLTIKVTDQYEVWDNNKKWLNHTITINGTKYAVFKNFTEMGWGEAVQRLVEILNSELAKQNKEDRFYPVSGGNDGRIILLSDEQFNHIDSVYKNPNWKPLRLTDWCKAMGVKYMSVD
jgi:hypothetical protein